MSLASIIRNGRGTTHGWRIEVDGPERTLVHYSTPLLRWSVAADGEHKILSLGWGSVSDQNGFNTAFRELGIPYRYARDQRCGGARVVELVRNGDGYLTWPTDEAAHVVAS